jgi:hypothetical protein
MNEVNKQSNYRKFVRKRFDNHDYMDTQHSGRGLAMGDLDGDGDADIVFSNNVEPAAIVENQTEQSGNNIRVKLIGTNNNRDAIGCGVTLHCSTGKLLRMTKGGASYLSQNDKQLHWSIPSDATIEYLSIKWPNGHIQKVKDVPTDKPLVVIQPTPTITVVATQ